MAYFGLCRICLRIDMGYFYCVLALQLLLPICGFLDSNRFAGRRANATKCQSQAKVYENNVTNNDAQILDVDPRHCLVWGPGLSVNVTLPIHYIYIQLANHKGKNLTAGTQSLCSGIHVAVTVTENRTLPIRTRLYDLHNGQCVVQYHLYHGVIDQFLLTIRYDNVELPGSPYRIRGVDRGALLLTPPTIDKWVRQSQCPKENLDDIIGALKWFPLTHSNQIEEVIAHRDDCSMAHYTILKNRLFCQLHGENVWLHNVVDQLLLWILRHTLVPDMSLLVCLDTRIPRCAVSWKHPVLSFITTSTPSPLILLPHFSVLKGIIDPIASQEQNVFATAHAYNTLSYGNRRRTVYWRGLLDDSSIVAKQLCEKSKSSHLSTKLDARFIPQSSLKLENTTFGRYKEGLSLTECFTCQAAVSIEQETETCDPNLVMKLGAQVSVVKVGSPVHQWLEDKLIPMTHHVPCERDLSDLDAVVNWLLENPERALRISQNGQEFVLKHFTPHNVMCYCMELLAELGRLQTGEVKLTKVMAEVTRHSEF